VFAGDVERGQEALGAATVSEHDPRPSEAGGDVKRERRVVGRGPRQRGVDVGALGPDEGEVLVLATAVDAFGG
jgi:hypothetical protein